jgi:hypothetical protein
MQSEAGNHRPPTDSGTPLLYRFVLQTVIFHVFLPWLRFWPGQFYNHKIEAYKKNFEDYGIIIVIRETGSVQLWRSGEPRTLFINTSSFCYFDTIQLVKLFKNYC